MTLDQIGVTYTRYCQQAWFTVLAILVSGTAGLPDPRGRNQELPLETVAPTEVEITTVNDELVRLPRESQTPQPSGALPAEPENVQVTPDELSVILN